MEKVKILVGAYFLKLNEYGESGNFGRDIFLKLNEYGESENFGRGIFLKIKRIWRK